MPGITDNLQFTVRPVLMKLPGVIQWANHRSDRERSRPANGQSCPCRGSLIRLKERIVGEVVTFDPSDGQRTLRLGETIDHQRVRTQGRGPAFPGRPGFGRVHLGDLIVAGQTLVESAEQVFALIQRDRRDVVLPVIREQTTRARLIEPLDFLRTAEKNPRRIRPCTRSGWVCA